MRLTRLTAWLAGAPIDPTPPPRVRATPRLRGGVHMSLGGGSTATTFAGGTGLGAELGAQWTPWLATSVEGYADTVIGAEGEAGVVFDGTRRDVNQNAVAQEPGTFGAGGRVLVGCLL